MSAPDTKLITGTIAPDTRLTAGTTIAELVSTDWSMTFHTGGREVLRITNEARLVIGEGLSKDEATQETAKLLVAAFDAQIQKMVDNRVSNLKSELEKMVLIAGQKADSNVELRMRAEKAEAESNKLLEHGIQALMIARSWVMVWGDKLSPESVALFTKHEQEFLSATKVSK